MVTLRRSLPPMNALVVFEAAARHRNLTAAGAELCIAASAVSRHVATVERETGLTLFIRNGNRLELTASGQRLADAVGAGLGHVRNVLASLKQRDVNRTLTIACSHDLAQNWLMPRFRELAGLLDDWKLRVITATSYEDFDAADIDLSIRFGDGNWPGFTAVHLFAEEAFPICAPALLERHPELLNAAPRTLMKFPLLRLARAAALRLASRPGRSPCPRGWSPCMRGWPACVRGRSARPGRRRRGPACPGHPPACRCASRPGRCAPSAQRTPYTRAAAQVSGPLAPSSAAGSAGAVVAR